MEPTPVIPTSSTTEKLGSNYPSFNREFPQDAKLELDDRGFCVSPNGSFWDEERNYFNRDGFDIHGGSYDKYGDYHPGPGWNKETGTYDDNKGPEDINKSEERAHHVTTVEGLIIKGNDINFEKTQEKLALSSDSEGEEDDEVIPQEEEKDMKDLMDECIESVQNEVEEKECTDQQNAEGGKLAEALQNDAGEIKENMENKV